MRVTFGAEHSEHLSLQFEFPPKPEMSPWLDIQVQIAVTGFRGQVSISVEVDDLVRFHDQLVRLYETLSGIARFETREGQLQLEVSGNGRGGIAVRGTAYAHATYGSKLEFEIDLDQTYLVAPLSELGLIRPKHAAA
jgi:hypothetical protein